MTADPDPATALPRVLCIEDDAATAQLMKRGLERTGYQVEIADTATAGLARFAAEPWAAVVLDHQLPDHTGIDVLDRMQALRELPATIMVTGSGSEAVVVAALKRGAHDYLVKDAAESYLLLLPEVVGKARQLVREREEAAAMTVERERLVAELTEALSKIKTLSGFIPICAACKSIRNDKGFWESLESYLTEHSDALLTHGMCPGCLPKYFPSDGYEEGEL